MQQMIFIADLIACSTCYGKLAASGGVTQLVSKIFGQISRVSSSQQNRGKISYKHISGN